MTAQQPKQILNRTVTAQVTPETEEQLRLLAAQSGQTVETFLGSLAETAVRQARDSGSEMAVPVQKRSPEERVAALQEWVNSHGHITETADDNRDSIYAGRGE